MSTEYQSRVSIKGIDQHSTVDAFSTHDPIVTKQHNKRRMKVVNKKTTKTSQYFETNRISTLLN